MSEAVSVRGENALTGPEVLDALRALTMAVGRLEARLAEEDGKVTISHRDALSVQKAIRARAGEIAGKYRLTKEGEKKIRAAIKKETLRMYGIADLHDLPAKRLPACRLYVSGWTSFAAVKEAAACQK